MYKKKTNINTTDKSKLSNLIDIEQQLLGLKDNYKKIHEDALRFYLQIFKDPEILNDQKFSNNTKIFLSKNLEYFESNSLNSIKKAITYIINFSRHKIILYKSKIKHIQEIDSKSFSNLSKVASNIYNSLKCTIKAQEAMLNDKSNKGNKFESNFFIINDNSKELEIVKSLLPKLYELSGYLGKKLLDRYTYITKQSESVIDNNYTDTNYICRSKIDIFDTYCNYCELFDDFINKKIEYVKSKYIDSNFLDKKNIEKFSEALKNEYLNLKVKIEKEISELYFRKNAKFDGNDSNFIFIEEIENAYTKYTKAVNELSTKEIDKIKKTDKAIGLLVNDLINKELKQLKEKKTQKLEHKKLFTKIKSKHNHKNKSQLDPDTNSNNKSKGTIRNNDIEKSKKTNKQIKSIAKSKVLTKNEIKPKSKQKTVEKRIGKKNSKTNKSSNSKGKSNILKNNIKENKPINNQINFSKLIKNPNNKCITALTWDRICFQKSLVKNNSDTFNKNKSLFSRKYF